MTNIPYEKQRSYLLSKEDIALTMLAERDSVDEIAPFKTTKFLTIL